MLEENKIINGLWIGSSLSPLELLTIHSFTEHGHDFHLWVYGELNVSLPKNVFLKDANTIIPEAQVFRKKLADPKLGIGKGSFGSPFSDLFRYKLLYEKGGWWVDMDVTCLKPFNFSEPYFFRSHLLLPMVGNIMKVPKHSELMRQAYQLTAELCNENTEDWLLPNKTLNSVVKKLGLTGYIQDERGNHDWWEKIEPFLLKNTGVPNDWFFIHWMNEEWRRRGISKLGFNANSSLVKLFQEYNITVSLKNRRWPDWLSRLRHKMRFL